MAKDVNELVKKAAEAAKPLPENLQEAAFNRAFEYLVNEQSGGTSSPAKSAKSNGGGHAPSKSTTKAKPQSDKKSRADLLDQLNRTNHPEIAHDNGSLINSLYLLRAVHKELDIDGLTAPEIARVITEKFRFKVTHQAIRQALDPMGQLVDRSKIGNSIFYRIMGPGEHHLDDFEAGIGTEVKASPKKKTANKPKGKAKKKKSTKKAAKKKTSTKKSVGAFACVSDLFEKGFFETPRTIGEIVENLKHKHGRKFESSQISPSLLRHLRNGNLTREKNKDNQYEYKNV